MANGKFSTTSGTSSGSDKTPCKCLYKCGIVISCVIGVLLSIYALNIEIKVEADPSYEAMCDISEHISCTKAFTSEYSRGFGIIGSILGEESILNQPNPLYGIIFYAIIGLLSE